MEFVQILLYINFLIAVLITSTSLKCLIGSKLCPQKWLWIWFTILGFVWIAYLIYSFYRHQTGLISAPCNPVCRTTGTVTLGIIYGIILHLKEIVRSHGLE